MKNMISILLSLYYVNNKVYLVNDGNVKIIERYCLYIII